MYMRGATPQSVAGLAAAAAAAGACALWYLRYRGQRALAARVGLEAAHSLFDQIDVDDDGTISREQLDVWLRKRPTWAASHGIRGVESVFAALVGGNDQAKIDKSSFVAWLPALVREPSILTLVDQTPPGVLGFCTFLNPDAPTWRAAWGAAGVGSSPKRKTSPKKWLWRSSCLR